jgi:hypothetical protein
MPLLRENYVNNLLPILKEVVSLTPDNTAEISNTFSTAPLAGEYNIVAFYITCA